MSRNPDGGVEIVHLADGSEQMLSDVIGNLSNSAGRMGRAAAKRRRPGVRRAVQAYRASIRWTRKD